MTHPVTHYRGYRIYYDPPPIPIRTCDWRFAHDDFDGAPDANDPRCGSAASVQDAKEEIDWIEDEIWPEKSGAV